jgi:hypothetical protein
MLNLQENLTWSHSAWRRGFLYYAEPRSPNDPQTGVVAVSRSVEDQRTKVTKPSTLRGKGRDFQIGTNFRTSTTPVDKITCDRYLTCESLLTERKKVTSNALVEILDRTKAKQESGSTTWYSVLVELKKKRVGLYRKGNFSKMTNFDLIKELTKGPRRLDMDEFIAESIKK